MALRDSFIGYFESEFMEARQTADDYKQLREAGMESGLSSVARYAVYSLHAAIMRRGYEIASRTDDMNEVLEVTRGDTHSYESTDANVNHS